MGVGLALGIAGIASAAGSAIVQGRAAKRAAESQERAALKSGELGTAFTSRQLGLLRNLSRQQSRDIDRFARSFQRTSNATEFLEDALNLSGEGFDFRDELKKSNLEFILGESTGDLRKAQGDFTNLAAGNFSAFERELNASLSKAGAESFGSPVGTVFNIAARDRFNFRTAGLNEALKIGDFFATQGTVDPPDPIPTAFALADFQQRENARFQDFNNFLLNARLQTGSANFDRGTRIGTVGLLAETNSLNAIGQLGGVSQAATASSLAGLSQAFSTGSSLFQDRQTNQQNQETLKQFLEVFGTNRSANQVVANSGAGFGNNASARPF
jgi:hypothetical protein